MRSSSMAIASCVLAETRSDRQRLGERSVLVSDVVRLRSSSPSSSALHQGRSASAFYQSTIGLDVAFAHCTLGSKHRDRLAARRWNGTPFYETRYGKIVEHGLVESLTDSIRLRALGLGTGVIDILDREVELILMPLWVAAVFAAAVGQYAQQLNLMAIEERNHSIITKFEIP